ncbi:MAG TPA: amidohydrolase, partial [Verrucomicrobiae bacterium]|nr:amidohydrolase [Verrucomicrobiae bacterium]
KSLTEMQSRASLIRVHFSGAHVLLSSIKPRIVDFLASRASDYQEIAELLYSRPETALAEYEASALLTATLEREGFEVQRGVAGMDTAFTATFGGGSPCVCILAEMDALPGLGHACGHNIIAAAAVGAAVSLRHTLPQKAGRVCVYGTPAEEQGLGKAAFITHGLFSEVDFAMMVHPSSRRTLSKQYLGVTKIRFVFKGKGAHAAAYPEEGINALDAVILTFNGVNALRQQLRQDVRVHGIITDGGTAPNIIPERAEALFYVRAEDSGTLDTVTARVAACAAGAAQASGCTLEVFEDAPRLHPFLVNEAFVALYRRQLDFLGLEEVVHDPVRSRGSSDIANVSQVVPTIHPHVPIGQGVRIHTPEFALATMSREGKGAVLEGATALALTAAELLLDEGVREEIRAVFRSKTPISGLTNS